MNLTQALTLLKAAQAEARAAWAHYDQDPDEGAGNVRFDAAEDATGREIDAERLLRSVAKATAGLDPLRNIKTPVAIQVDGGLLVVLPIPSDGPTEDPVVFIDAENIKTANE